MGAQLSLNLEGSRLAAFDLEGDEVGTAGHLALDQGRLRVVGAAGMDDAGHLAVPGKAVGDLERGLEVVGFYHHKSDDRLRVEDVKKYARKFGFKFPVAIDPDWRTLRRWWLAATGSSGFARSDNSAGRPMSSWQPPSAVNRYYPRQSWIMRAPA